MSADIPAVTTPTGAWKNYPNTTTPITAEELNERDVALRAIIEALNTGDVPDGFTASGSAVDTVIAERIPPPLTPAQVVDEVMPVGSVTFGAYTEDVGRAPGSRIREITRWGLRPRLTLSYPKLGAPWVDLNTAPVYGTVPVITWEPMVADTDPPVLAAVAAGDHDDDVRRGCREVAEAIRGGMTVILRIMHEMNGDWYPWCGPVNDATGATAASAYIAAFQHIAAIIREELPSTPIMWAPNASSHPAESWNAAINYYPGADYVDVIGLDGYDWGDERAQSFGDIFAAPVAALTPLGKPIVVAETGSAATGVSNRSQWVRDMRETLTTDLPQVRGLIWFDSNKERIWSIGAQGDIPAWAEVSAQMTPLPTAPSWAQALDRVADRTTSDPLGLYAASTIPIGAAVNPTLVTGPVALFARVVYGSGMVRSIGFDASSVSPGATVQVCVFRSESYGRDRRPGWREGDSGTVAVVEGRNVVNLVAPVHTGPDDFLAIAVNGEVEIETVSGGENARALGLAYRSAVFPIPWSGATYTLSPTLPVLHGLT